MSKEHVATIRFSQEMWDKLSENAEKFGVSKAEAVRRAVEIMMSGDQVVVPLSVKERLFIEGICDTAGVQPSDAVKIVLLSYHTLMSSPLWKIVKPVEEILAEMKQGE